ncbi:class F sortase [Blastococcus sp. CT_GayMR16]|uniref:class F sortase n=1 Tax=Blastococcus sp. CT_GayMR16 TaxID=2559607 RepID=UPI001431B016|nr:class F sortase [Blastococcus sp. CT_GayMR16]
MSGTTQPPPSQDDASDNEPSLLESEFRKGDGPARSRRWGIPVWLLPTLGALAAGVLVGYFIFGGTDARAPRPVAAVPTTTSEAPQPASPVVTSLARAEPVQLDIPAIEVSSSLVDLGLNTDGTLEVPVDFAKAGWFTGGNYPGDPQGPPALLAGHVDDYTGPAVFYRLPELAVGDEVLVTRADNTVAVFSVTGSQQYPKDALPTDQVYAPVGDSEIVLITCTGDFDRSARSYQDNLVVRATLNMARSLEESDKRAASGQPVPAADLPNV